jgi:hypothetical protein
MKFGRWYALAEAHSCAPAEPGVYQLRVRQGLVEYPTGKSAMVHYGAGDDVRAALLELSTEHGDRDLLARHAVEMSTIERADPSAAARQLLDRFERRFGAQPTVPR